jgi:hypothetical protein
MRNLDAEIHAVEERIARERNSVATLLDEYGETVRDAVTAPKSLLAVVALGFVLGEVSRSSRSTASPRRMDGLWARLGALAASTATGLIRARYGSPWLLLARPSRPTPR